jgi:hypothetical protein
MFQYSGKENKESNLKLNKLPVCRQRIEPGTLQILTTKFGSRKFFNFFQIFHFGM